MKNIIFLCLLSIIIVLANCTDSPDSAYESRHQKRVEKRATLAAKSRVGALPLQVKSPADNPISKEKIALGKSLFYDPILSGDKDVACVTCHHPSTGYAEFRDLSIGVNGKGLHGQRRFKFPNAIPFVKRNSQTILNTAFNGIALAEEYDPVAAPMFWDVRAKGLEAQALEPIKSFEEMRGAHYGEDEILTEVIHRLQAIPTYQALFMEAFNEPDAINVANLGKAIAAFERSLVTNNSRFDQYMRGDRNAISRSEKHGFDLFKKVGCTNCHNGPMFSDFKMHVLGVPENDKLPKPDLGFEDQYSFRTPSLRNLRFTEPYMHNGKFTSLLEVLEFYEDISMRKVRNPALTTAQLDPLVKELKIRVKDMRPIISFLNTLNDENFDKTIPEAVPSGLAVGGDIQ
ncbi:MAG: cytochrome-c peroxidase [Saprospiraceae bacterium]